VLLTVGHGPEDRTALAARLRGAAVDLVVDVRRFPGSRADPTSGARGSPTGCRTPASPSSPAACR
jgi:uncharacterized protein (DUF488 family)